jgi:hypothetical protein
MDYARTQEEDRGSSSLALESALQTGLLMLTGIGDVKL